MRDSPMDILCRIDDNAYRVGDECWYALMRIVVMNHTRPRRCRTRREYKPTQFNVFAVERNAEARWVNYAKQRGHSSKARYVEEA